MLHSKHFSLHPRLLILDPNIPQYSFTQIRQRFFLRLLSLNKSHPNSVDFALEADLGYLVLIMADTQPLLHTHSTLSLTLTSVRNPTDPESEHYVRLCPHQTLSFDTFKRFANLPGMKTGEKLDVFPEPHRHATRFRLSSGQCFVRNWEIDVDFVASAYLEDKNGNANEEVGDMVLHVDWECFLGSFPSCKDQKSRKSLRRTFERPKIWLCPHMNLGDEYFVDVAYNFLHPVKITCPLERHVVSREATPRSGASNAIPSSR